VWSAWVVCGGLSPKNGELGWLRVLANSLERLCEGSRAVCRAYPADVTLIAIQSSSSSEYGCEAGQGHAAPHFSLDVRREDSLELTISLHSHGCRRYTARLISRSTQHQKRRREYHSRELSWAELRSPAVVTLQPRAVADVEDITACSSRDCRSDVRCSIGANSRHRCSSQRQ
jgi:hypothetical protein